jgi:hypothetical protein
MAPFIYKGAGRRGGPHLNEAQNRCIKEACAIQRCLARNASNEKYCQNYIEFYYKCVETQTENLAQLKMEADERIAAAAGPAAAKVGAQAREVKR